MTTQPAPLLVSPSWSFDGDDGAWSTFAVSVGNPLQHFRLTPSTSISETWVPLPEGCQGILDGITDCGNLRGVSGSGGEPSSGFQTNSSSTWSAVGIYQLASENTLFPGHDNGLYGHDTITLHELGLGAGKQNVSSQTVAGYASINYWLGSLGLGVEMANFTVQSNGTPSLLETLKTNDLIPSLSYGYAAGASYINDYGSLTLGGFDQLRSATDNLTSSLQGPTNSTLVVNVESIVAQNVIGGTQSLVTDGNVVATIDSTVSQMWLPQAVCDNFQRAFGLTYDDQTDLYLVNASMHARLRSTNPTVTFTIGDAPRNSTTTNIVFPYSAFDLNASIPMYNSSTPYFPIQIAANASQVVLGRAFLQEAYLAVDWERSQMTIAQVNHQNATSHIVPILPLSSEKHASTGLSTGALVGIIVGAVLGVLIAVLIGLLVIIRKRRKQSAIAKVSASEEEGDMKTEAAELHDQSAVHEMSDDHKRVEAADTPLTEMPDDQKPHEMAGTHIVEMPGDDGADELQGDSRDDPDKKVRRWEVYEMP